MAYEVFISYSTHDLHPVDELVAMLNTPGVHAFAAEYSVLPGGDLSPEIMDAIGTCDLFILLWSQNAKESEWVPQEIGIAVANERQIIPVVLDRDLAVPGFIQNRKYLPAYDGPAAAMRWVQQHVVDRANQKRQQSVNVLTALALGGAFLWLVSQSEDDEEAEVAPPAVSEEVLKEETPVETGSVQEVSSPPAS